MGIRPNANHYYVVDHSWLLLLLPANYNQSLKSTTSTLTQPFPHYILQHMRIRPNTNHYYVGDHSWLLLSLTC